MIQTSRFALCSLVLLTLPSLSAFAQEPPPADVSKNSGSVVATTPTPEPSAAMSQNAENAVVKVFSTLRRADPLRPWSKQAPAEATGSGVVIEGHRILTNAHV